MRYFSSDIEASNEQYFSVVIDKNQHKTRVLINTLNSVINPPAPDCLDASLQTCENFLKYFIEEIENTRSSIRLPITIHQPHLHALLF